MTREFPEGALTAGKRYSPQEAYQACAEGARKDPKVSEEERRKGRTASAQEREGRRKRKEASQAKAENSRSNGIATEFG